jgi:hypothetical protein
MPQVTVEDGIYVITGFAAGADLTIERTVTDLPAGETIAEARLLVKAKSSDSDTLHLLEKEVSEVPQPGVGLIVNDGDQAVISFNLLSADTIQLATGRAYYYYIAVKTSAGLLDLLERGYIETDSRISSF